MCGCEALAWKERAVSKRKSRPGKGRRQDKTGRSKSEEQYAKMPYPMLKSKAWRSLSGNAMKVYCELHCRFWGTNNGEITLSFGEAAELLGIGKATVQRALEELVEKGFIERTRRGHFYGRRASTYRLTKERTGTEPATRDWEKWRPDTEQKSEHGSETDPSAPSMGPSQNRRRVNGSVSKPVKAREFNPIGSDLGRIY